MAVELYAGRMLETELKICGKRWIFFPLGGDEAFYLTYSDTELVDCGISAGIR
jgi:hypothetical protein